MLVKKHLSPKEELILAVCDKAIFGNKYEEGDLQLDCSVDFYNGEEISIEELKDCLNHFTSANVVGEKSISFFRENGFLEDSDIKLIDGIPYAHVFRISDECGDCTTDSCSGGVCYCDLTSGTPTCELRDVLTPECVDCLDNEPDGFFDFNGYANDGVDADGDCTGYDGALEEGSAEPAVPEFSTFGLILVVLIAIAGIFVIRKMNK